MDVKPSYKQTKAGVIPDDWEDASIGSLASFTSGNGISVASLQQQSPDTPVPVYGGNGVAGYTAKPLIQEPVVVVGRVGQKCGEVYLTQGPAWITDNALYPRTIFREVDMRFLALAMKASGLNDVKNRNDLPLITQAILHSAHIPLPPSKAEQRAIAEALSDADALIESLEQLITKKRQVKQGAMQELLTCKRRLPGFSGKWARKKLGSIGIFRSGSGFPIKYQSGVEGTYPFFKVSDMNNDGNSTLMVFSNNWIAEAVRKEIGANTFPRHSIVFAKIGAAIFLERKRILSQESCIDNNMMGFILDEVIAYYRYIHYLLLNTQIGKLVSTSALPSLSGKQIAEMEYDLPEIKEQYAIAEILSDMDTEIAALEDKLAKARQIKQGMMQELLTGRIRLVGG